jgi:hypothetical protein
MPDMELRVRIAAESLLENEALRGFLDDESATTLLDWGMALAKELAASTDTIEDDEEANEAIYPRMRALRKMLEGVKAIAVSRSMMERLQGAQNLVPQAKLVFGEAFREPGAGEIGALAFDPGKTPSETIEKIRDLLQGESDE